MIISEVYDPAPLSGSLSTSIYGDYEVSCNDATDGSLQIVPFGGNPSYSYSWSNGDDSEVISGLTKGEYTLTIIDSNGCSWDTTSVLTAPPTIIADVNFINPGCSDIESGSIIINEVIGGLGSYEYSLDNTPFSTQRNFESLGPGTYSITVIDSLDCKVEIIDSLIGADIPKVELPSIMEIDLGDSLTLFPELNNSQISTIEWFSNESLSCFNCLNPSVQPINSSDYIIRVTSIDGCSDEAEISIKVKKSRKFYYPNAFSPNDDGINDIFYITGGSEVRSIDLQVYNRWGSLVFDQKNLNIRDINRGWDGKFNGRSVEVGVYVWKADITFIDDAIEVYSGDITLIR